MRRPLAPHWRSVYLAAIVSRHLTVAPMFLFASRLGFVLVLAMLCLGGRAAHAQAAPVTYFIPFWPIGFGGDPNAGQSANTYGNFPSFDGNDARGSGFSYARYNFPNGWFVGGAGGGLSSSMNGFNQYGAFGNSLSYEGVQFGYKFQNDVTIHAGFDTLKYNPSIGAPFGAFDTTSAYRSGSATCNNSRGASTATSIRPRCPALLRPPSAAVAANRRFSSQSGRCRRSSRAMPRELKKCTNSCAQLSSFCPAEKESLLARALVPQLVPGLVPRLVPGLVPSGN